MIKKIGHYALENPTTIHDEEAMTALELAGRTAGKVNECIEQVNKNTENLPGMVNDTVQKHIDNGAFNDQISKFAGDLSNRIEEVDNKHDAQIAEEAQTLNARIDNIVANPGDGTIPTEVVDARTDPQGTAHPSLKKSIEEQVRLAHNHNSVLLYQGGGNCVTFSEASDGAINMDTYGRLAFYGRGSTTGGILWETSMDNIDPANKKVLRTVNEGGKDVIYDMRITIPPYRVLVYDRYTQKYNIVPTTSTESHHVIVCANGYHNPYRGTVVEEWLYRHMLKAEQNMYAVRGAYLYGGQNFKMDFVSDEDTPALDVTLYGRPTVCYGSETYMAEFIGDAIKDIANNITYPTGTEYNATIKIPGWNALVWNHLEKRWKFRWRANLKEGDILALATGYCQPLCGTLLEEWSAKKNQEFEKYIGSESVGFNPPKGVTEFAGLLNNTNANTERFLWFTDPHLCEASEWQTEFETYKNHLKACYDGTATDFAVCGGDWLGNGDTQDMACFKLGYINAQMQSIFGGNYYPVLGNHDTNYQGIKSEGADPRTGQLRKETNETLWRNDSKYQSGNMGHYYKFNTPTTQYYVFDSELDWDLTMSEYKYEQILWFAEELLYSINMHSVAFIHIYYNWDGTTNHTGEMGDWITKIAQAYNNRGTIDIDGDTFDYSRARGKFHFVLAGHNHSDAVTTENGIPVVLTTKTRQDGVPTFDLCLVDYKKNKLHLCRVGAGESRTVDI